MHRDTDSLPTVPRRSPSEDAPLRDATHAADLARGRVVARPPARAERPGSRPLGGQRPPSEVVYGARRRAGWLLRSASAAGLALVAGAALVEGVNRWQRRRDLRAGEPSTREAPATHLAARSLHQGASLLALSVLADSALEHYRALFERRAMYVAPTVAAGTLVTSLAAGARPGAKSAPRSAVYAAALLTGVVGSGFHIHNMRKRPDGFSWNNLLYAAPLGAPLAITLAGALGLAADHLQGAGEPRTGEHLAREPGVGAGGRAAGVGTTALRERSDSSPVQSADERGLPRLLGLPADRLVASGTGLALLGNAAEVWLLHFRGAFQNPFMYVPVLVPPAAAALLMARAFSSRPSLTRAARVLLRATAATGLAGVGFHVYGIQRNMGGFRNWSQMLLQGPPVPAPPAFTGLALAGLGALRLLEERT